MSSTVPTSKGIYPGRYTAQIEGDFVVFLIGSQLNTWRALRRYTRVGDQMSEMQRVLNQHPAKGYLGGENYFSFFPLRTLLMSYWRSFEALEHFARSKDEPHAAAWGEFNRLIGDDGTIGIWHETYMVTANSYEVVYGNMPRFGLARAGEHLPIQGRNHTARGRYSGEQQSTPDTITDSESHVATVE